MAKRQDISYLMIIVVVLSEWWGLAAWLAGWIEGGSGGNRIIDEFSVKSDMR